MLRKLYLGALLCLISFGGLRAQDALSFVPKEAFSVTVMDLAELDKAIDFEAVKQSQFYQKADREVQNGSAAVMSKVYGSPSEAGLNPAGRLILAQFPAQNMTVNRLLIPLTDAVKFAKIVDELAASSPTGFTKSKKGKFQFYTDKNEGAIGWTDDLAVITFITDENGDLYEGLDYSDSLFSEKVAARTEVRKALKIKELAAQILDLTDKKGRSKNITAYDNFKEFYADKFQIGTWMNVGLFAINSLAKIPDENNERGKKITENVLKGLEGNTFARSYIDFTEDKIEMRNQFGGGKELADKMFAALDRKISEKLLKYIPGKEALFVFSAAADLQKAGEAAADYAFAVSGDAEESKKVKAGYELLAVFLDEKAIFELLPGEMVAAITDVREADVKYTTYDYDEDYNRIEVEKTRKQTLPVFTAAFAVGNRENFDKLVKALELAEQLEKDGKGYRIINKDFPKEMAFLALTPDALLITNDENIIANPEKGFPVSEQFKPEMKTLVTSHNLLTNLDLSQILLKSGNALRALSPGLGKETVLDKVAETLRDLRLTGMERKGNMLEIKTELLLAKGSGNSVNALLKLAEEVMEIMSSEE